MVRKEAMYVVMVVIVVVVLITITPLSSYYNLFLLSGYVGG